jgi:hypothetical protein
MNPHKKKPHIAAEQRSMEDLLQTLIRATTFFKITADVLVPHCAYAAVK